jgi:hypothetical protein
LHAHVPSTCHALYAASTHTCREASVPLRGGTSLRSLAPIATDSTQLSKCAQTCVLALCPNLGGILACMCLRLGCSCIGFELHDCSCVLTARLVCHVWYVYTDAYLHVVCIYVLSVLVHACDVLQQTEIKFTYVLDV